MSARTQTCARFVTRHYLDAASASPLRPLALAAMTRALQLPLADPSRIHTEGLTVRHQLELARESVAALLGARPSEVVFTSSASEAIATAVHGSLAAVPGGVVLASAVEHSAVRLSAGPNLQTVPVNSEGLIAPNDLRTAIQSVRDSGQSVALVAVQLGNHEMGALQPIEEVANVCAELDVLLLVDAAQAAGRVPIAFTDLGIAFMAISGPKLGGPAGTGALLIKRGKRVAPLVRGGDQERGRRAGLENIPALVGLGAACAELMDTMVDESAGAQNLTSILRSGLESLEGVELYGPADQANRLPHLVCAGVKGIEPQAVLLGLDRAGVAAHSGSACASESLEPSPILEAMGVDAHHSLRLSVSWATSGADVSAALAALPGILSDLRALHR